MLQLSWRAREVTKWNGRSMREVNQLLYSYSCRSSTRSLSRHPQIVSLEARPLHAWGSQCNRYVQKLSAQALPLG